MYGTQFRKGSIVPRASWQKDCWVIVNLVGILLELQWLIAYSGDCWKLHHIKLLLRLLIWTRTCGTATSTTTLTSAGISFWKIEYKSIGPSLDGAGSFWCGVGPVDRAWAKGSTRIVLYQVYLEWQSTSFDRLACLANGRHTINSANRRRDGTALSTVLASSLWLFKH